MIAVSAVTVVNGFYLNFFIKKWEDYVSKDDLFSPFIWSCLYGSFVDDRALRRLVK